MNKSDHRSHDDLELLLSTRSPASSSLPSMVLVAAEELESPLYHLVSAPEGYPLLCQHGDQLGNFKFMAQASSSSCPQSWEQSTLGQGATQRPAWGGMQGTAGEPTTSGSKGLLPAGAALLTGHLLIPNCSPLPSVSK